ncbi:class F sortase [Streptomyces sp. NPDC047525]|uniref:class F sortase n=1 Tax=Streptomyces sp. NPDC047525 TaxID=3155264 RepID=UPI0033FA656E
MSTPTEEAPVPASTPAPARRRHTTRIAAAATLTAALGVGLIACGQGSGDPAPDVKVHNAAAAPAAEPHAPLEKSRPTGLRIPAAGVDATSMLDLGVGADDALEVPPADKAEEPGWWTGGVTPGEKGAAVLVAHYDTAKGPALMKNVAKVRMGDEIEVPRADGSTATFKVREIEQVDKKNFPTHKVYGATDRPELRLLTCGGPIKDGHRTDNIILYADLAP